MDLKTLHCELEALHAQGDSTGILKSVEQHISDLQPLARSPWIGSIYRYAMLACYRQQEYQEGDVWWDRAMEQFASTGYLKGVAYMLVTPTFRSLDLIPAHTAMQSVALMVIRCVEAIAEATAGLSQDNGEDEVIADSVLLRVASEKHAYCLSRLGRWPEALAAYGRALNHVSTGDPKQTQSQLREELKVRGGAALARYFVGEPGDRAAAIHALTQIEQRSRLIPQVKEVHDITVENLRLFRQTPDIDFNGLHHYDIR